MKILIVAPPYFALTLPFERPAGTERVVIGLTLDLVKRGHEVFLLAPPRTSLPGATIRSYPFPAVEIEGETHYLQLAQVAGSVATHVANALGVDVVHFHLEGSETFSPFVTKPMVVTIHNSPDICAQFTVPHFPEVAYAAISQHSSVQLREMGATNIHVVYNDVEVQALLAAPRTEENYALFFGRVINQKGADLALKVAEAAGLRLVIAGPEPAPAQRGWFEQNIRPFIDDDMVRYVGSINDAQKLEYLCGARVALLLNRDPDAFGISAVECLAAGTPVLTTDKAGGMAEIVGDGGIVLPFTENDAALVKTAVAAITNLAITPQTCRERARLFSKQAAERYEALYRWLINN